MTCIIGRLTYCYHYKRLFVKLTSTITFVCIILSLLAIVGKALHVPGMAVILIICLGIASVLFFFEVLLSIFYFKGHGIVVAISAIACFGLSTLLISVLFRFMFWPGWAPMLLVGGIPVLPALVLAILNQPAIKSMDGAKQKVLNQRIILPAILFLMLGVISWFVPEDVFWNIFSSQAVK